MNESSQTDKRSNGGPASRRVFLKRSAAVMAGGLAAGLSVARGAHAAGSDVIRLGLVGCDPAG
jgi:myo-inositol 2-dehydrogenase/D-chiro-inositol 1-dehydrogenase